ncbi:4-(cytidine 5'-diphospho)-2-C-methyl-D-erythritol kinase [Psychromarinibacter sp. C21-152]|uniref:4-diphosphocytidyl-2-C-methyl-D-erythritol kinase n=1 Tax=Psychromarinibacter sediminicola TaxID=3033385 RepID=A0AAE3NS30_9RHOB|nr:4-(cytidine 5'-diphospho)-2-C-methyl-D-erythritol kinase [Psychromarinibacter sediminicola]MDF0601031.1 4-(cytidine 5'-diphospho)-2-C-methyl-D-erythritol kinase [Psychromarinibacter sediminicola]
MAEAFAPAKINLTLHVTGQRPDGYHLLDSLVVFAGIGDRIAVAPADDLTLTVTGPMAAGVPTDGSNLVLRAARAMGVTGAAITLEKHLPAAAGIGGGSSDAAATLRALAGMTGREVPPDRGLSLGADVPVCLAARSCRMRGVGEGLEPVPDLPPLAAVLVNPGCAVSTPAVFRALAARDNPPMPDPLPSFDSPRTLAGWLADQRNDLEAPALAAAPPVAEALAALRAQSPLLARMSGSGATCFSLHESSASAEACARAVSAAHPDWWVRATTFARTP